MAKALLKEALSGSNFAVEAIDKSDTAHINFQKVRSILLDSKHTQLCSVLHHPANDHWLDVLSVANLQLAPSCVHSVWSSNVKC